MYCKTRLAFPTPTNATLGVRPGDGTLPTKINHLQTKRKLELLAFPAPAAAVETIAMPLEQSIYHNNDDELMKAVATESTMTYLMTSSTFRTYTVYAYCVVKILKLGYAMMWGRTAASSIIGGNLSILR